MVSPEVQEEEYNLEEKLQESQDDLIQSKNLLLSYVKKLDEEINVVVPEFEDDFEWLNVSNRLSFKDELRNKIVILDFFTYCCVNCLHILPDLEELEKRFPIEQGVVVIGVHSAKFSNEKVFSNILSAVLRYNIHHPVVNDSKAILWNKLQINCWPTLVVVGPGGKYLKRFVGEGQKSKLFDFIEIAKEYYSNLGLLGDENIPLSLEQNKTQEQTLCFPGKVCVSPDGNLLAVSDSGNNRVVLLEANGIVKELVGGKERGFKDGSFESSRFNSPQGLVFHGKDLYVADTDNHAIRKINLSTKEVVTVAGTGKQGNDKEGGKLGVEQELSSPWDVTLGRSLGRCEDNLLTIAMAGCHQVWALFMKDGKWLKGRHYSSGTCVRIAGSGNEENRNNSYPEKASFAQPSGITYAADTQLLYIADSESSTVRSMSLKDGSIKGIVGGERDPMNLFAYSDVDGVGIDAKLQHPLGLCVTPEHDLYVADSYNHKIKKINLKTKMCVTYGSPEVPDNNSVDERIKIDLNEPGGLCYDANHKKLYIANTNLHCINVIDVQSKKSSVLPVIFPREKSRAPVQDFVKPGLGMQEIGTAVVSPGGRLQVNLCLKFCPGVHFTEDAPSQWSIVCKEDEKSPPLDVGSKTLGAIEGVDNQVLTTLTFPESVGDHIFVFIKCKVFICDDSNVCRVKEAVYKQKVVFRSDDSSDSSSVVNISLTLD